MFHNKYRGLAVLLLLALLGSGLMAQETETSGKYEFTLTKTIPHMPVKNQSRTGTCWCFSTVSYLESEAIRLKNIKEDLSVMYVVRHTYPQKALNFVRLHGMANFGQGGQSHDVMDQVKRHGIVPLSDYTGLNYGETMHNHSEMMAMLSGIVNGVAKQRGITPSWMDAFENVLDLYLGTPPESVSYKGLAYSPVDYAEKVLGIIPEDYVELTSYSHHPFYKQCYLELPDNWTFNDEYYNVPIDVFEEITDQALKAGHSVVWDGDVSEKTFSSRETGYAIIPEEEGEKKDDIPGEVEITQEMRQKTFDDFSTTDDHLMHIVGLARDQEGGKYYYIKNSGGSERKFNGYLYMSKAYFRLKTTAIMVHKDALTKKMKKKLGIN